MKLNIDIYAILILKSVTFSLRGLRWERAVMQWGAREGKSKLWSTKFRRRQLDQEARCKSRT